MLGIITDTSSGAVKVGIRAETWTRASIIVSTKDIFRDIIRVRFRLLPLIPMR